MGRSTPSYEAAGALEAVKSKPTGEPKQQLRVTDERTGKVITISITNNSIPATAFNELKLPAVGSSSRAEDEEKRGLRVFDPGFMNTAVVQSKITFIDGDAGILRYRGYPIEQLAEKSTFLESAYLLLYGDLPGKREKAIFEDEVMSHSFPHADLERIMSAFRYDAHPQAMMLSAFGALGSFHAEANPALQGQKLYSSGSDASLQAMDKQIYRLIGKAPTLAAMAYRVRQGRPFNRPPSGLSYAASFLYQIDKLGDTVGPDGTPQPFSVHPVFERAIDILFLLHADHELNASTAAALSVGSTGVDPYSAVAAATAALYGPLHGGANEAVIRMLQSIGSVDKVPAFIEKVKRKEAVLSGFGHRIYKTHDPRSTIIRKLADEVFAVTGSEPLLDIALKLQEVALADEYFVSRHLHPNVDFYSGLIYRAMGFPLDYFPVLFTVPRVVGWLAHWRQSMLAAAEGGLKIWRPRQLYVGAESRDYVPLEARPDQTPSDPRAHPSKVPHDGPSRRTRLANARVESKL